MWEGRGKGGLKISLLPQMHAWGTDFSVSKDLWSQHSG